MSEFPGTSAGLSVYDLMVQYFGADPNVAQIIQAEKFDVPSQDTLRFTALTRGRLTEEVCRKKVNKLYGDLDMPMLVDNFTDDNERDAWRNRVWKTLGQEAWDVLNENALRIASFVYSRNDVDFLLRHSLLSKDSEWEKEFHIRAEKVIEMATAENLEQYIGLSKADQAVYAKEFKRKIADFLGHFANTSL